MHGDSFTTRGRENHGLSSSPREADLTGPPARKQHARLHRRPCRSSAPAHRPPGRLTGRGRHSPKTSPGTSAEGEDSVPQVDVTGSAAVIKVSVRTAKWDFIDYISLLKVDGRWRIVAKVYHREPRAEAPSRSTSASP
ncbi:nuclear transport factor 2 family protein [Myxococcus sp. AB025B]|uniref:nuclear transport factor 2 family protein n=1 Tax=Myxococcus sp. AB025B TaxID=2562794 RepID=UPI001142F6C6|nr:nuclear transport factor 2 family protein [Myxococcus sp. AB025B]